MLVEGLEVMPLGQFPNILRLYGSIPQKDKTETLKDHFIERLSFFQDYLSRDRVEINLKSYSNQLILKAQKNLSRRNQNIREFMYRYILCVLYILCVISRRALIMKFGKK